MPRDLSSGLVTELLKSSMHPIFFVEITTSGGVVRLWSGLGTITWNSQTWSGVGKLGKISPIGETTEVRAEVVQLSLSGIPSDLISSAINDMVPNQPVNIWLGMANASGAVISDPYLALTGKTSAVTAEEGGDTSTIYVNVEGDLAALHQARFRRYTQEDQQIEFPGDLGFQYVEQIQNIQITWGKAGPQPFPVLAPPTTPDPGNGDY